MHPLSQNMPTKSKRRRISMSSTRSHRVALLSFLQIVSFQSISSSLPLAWSFSSTQHHHGRTQRVRTLSPIVRRRLINSNNNNGNSALSMISMNEAQEIFEVIANEAATLSTSVTPVDEAAMLTDLAEVSSDIVILSSAPETIFLRLSAVIQKLLELTSDYLPDHMIRSDELVFNLPIMATSTFLLFRSAEPIIKAQYIELDSMDLAAYELCFQPVGVTLLQFKSMKATGCFEWMECEAGRVLIDENDYDVSSSINEGEDDNDTTNNTSTKQQPSPTDWKYLYWQYNGQVIRSFRGNVFGSIQRHKGMHIDDPSAQGLLGDTRFLSHLEEESWDKQLRTKDTTRNDNNNDSNKRRRGVNNGSREGGINKTLHPIPTITIGQGGAKLLRIDSHKLFDLMDHDERLESSIRLLLLKSLKLKIGNLLYALQDNDDDGSDKVEGYEENRLEDGVVVPTSSKDKPQEDKNKPPL